MTFKIFEKRKGFHLTNNKVVYPILLFSICIAYLGHKILENSIIENVGIFGSVLGGVLMIYFKAVQNSRREYLNGTLDTKLKFFENRIIVNENVYSLKEIDKIEFYVGDYIDKWIYTGYGDLNPVRSNGTGNVCKITLNNGNKISVNFQLSYEDEFLKMKELLITYYTKNKIHFLKLIEYLRIEKYEEIQEFKKTLPLTFKA